MNIWHVEDACKCINELNKIDLVASLVSQALKNPPTVQETKFLLGPEDPLEMGMATHSTVFLCLENPWQRNLVSYN